jgi:hypothetical protein
MTTTMMADAHTDTNTPRQLQQQQQLPQQQRRNGKRWGVLTSKDIRGTGIGCVSRKLRPDNGSNNNRGGILPTAGKCSRDPSRMALPPLLPLFPPA